MIPDQSILAAGVGSGYALNVAGRSAEGRWILAYLSEPSTVSVRLESIALGSRANASWVNPASGDRVPAGTYAVNEPVSFTSLPGWEDAVLLVEAE